MYVEKLEKSAEGNALRDEEPGLLDTFEIFAAAVIDRYVPPGPRKRGSLVFDHLYSAQARSSPEDQRESLITALLAAEVEAGGPLRLTQAQNVNLAEIFERLGKGLSSDGLPLHAAFAFGRAAELYQQVGDHRDQDRCQFAEARARHRAERRGGIKVLKWFSWVLCGYGFRPYLLLCWVVVQLVIFSIVLTLIVGHSFFHNAYLCLINYLNPLGSSDTETLPDARSLLAVEGYLGYLSLTVFSALLVRRWFRT